MSASVLILWFLLGVLPLGVAGFLLGRRRPLRATAAGTEYHSTPDYYGWYTVVIMFLPALAASVIAVALELLDVAEMPGVLLPAAWVLLPLAALAPAVCTIRPGLRARNFVEGVVYAILVLASLVSILTTIAITLSVLSQAIEFFGHEQVSVLRFLTGTVWNPDPSFVSFRGETDVAEPRFGALPLFTGTMLITGLAMLVAVPLGVLSAVYISEYAPRPIRKTAKPLLEILAGIPTVVYGFFAAITLSPLIVGLSDRLGLDATYENALAPGLIMGVMIVPFMSSLSDDVISAVPQSLRRGAYALSSTRSEVVTRVVLPAALPGIVSAFLISVSRAIGETMIVVMAASLQAELTANPLDSVTTVTVQIVDALTGDQEFDSPHTLSAFGLGLTLLIMTLALNVVSAVVIRRFHQRYE